MNGHALLALLYHWHARQDKNGRADLDIALSDECGYCRAGAKGILAPDCSVGAAERGARPLVTIIFDALQHTYS